MNNSVANASPLVKSIDELHREADKINRSYRFPDRSINLDTTNRVSVVSDSVASVAGKQIDLKKFSNADFAPKYMDLFIGGSKTVRTMSDIVDNMSGLTDEEISIMTEVRQSLTSDGSPGTLFYVAANTSGTEIGSASVPRDRAGGGRILVATPIFNGPVESDPASSQKVQGLDMVSYCCAVPDPSGKLGVLNNALKRLPGYKSTDRLDQPGMMLVVHQPQSDTRSIKGLNFTSENADIIHAFFNGLTTLELSKATTFVRASFYSPGVSVKDSKGNYEVEPPMSLAKFLGFDRGLIKNSFSSLSADALIDKTIGSSKFYKGKSVTRMGMEMFLAPQTLTNPDINNTPRAFPVRDPMVPFASIDSFKITVQNSAIAAFTTTLAEMKITLHDKSRLRELANIISVQQFPSNYVEIEYGYMHPDMDPITGTAVSRFIGLMQNRQIFNVSGYSMSVKDQSIEIKLNLVSQANYALKTVPCITGDMIPVKLAVQFIENLDVESNTTRLFSKDTLGFDPNSSSGRMINRDLFVELAKIVRASSDPKKDPNVLSRLSSLASAIKSSSDITSGQKTPNQMQVEMLNAASFYSYEKGNDRVVNLVTPGFSSAFLKTPSGTATKYCSVAQLISRFVIAPLASSTVFDEVHVHFFSFNERAGEAAEIPISSLPIPVDQLLEFLNKAKDVQKIFTTGEMLNKITQLCSNPSNPAFGVSDILKTISDARKKQREAAEAAAAAGVPEPTTKPEPSPEEKAAQSQLKTKLEEIYRRKFRLNSVEDPVFKIPQIKSSVSAVRTVRGDKDINICRIIIYDDVSTPASDLSSFLGVAAESLTDPITNSASGLTLNYDKSKELNTVREILRRMYPVIKPGISNSLVTNIGVSTNSSGDIAQVQLIESLKQVYGSEQGSVPESSGDDVVTIPATVTVTSAGCPFISRGNTVFLDLGTGTALDNVYSVMSVTHDLGKEFRTSMSLSPIGSGTVRAVSTKLENAIKRFTTSS